MNTLANITDSLQSLVSRLGTSYDKTTSLTYVQGSLSDAQIEAAYRSDWLARKIIDIPAADATREWREWRADEKQITAIEAEEKRLGLQQKTRAALTKARLYGGAAIVIGDGASDPREPLLPDSVRKGGLQYLHVVSRRSLNGGQRVRNISSPYYGVPEFYTVDSTEAGSIEMHASRIVRFTGAEYPNADTAETVWADSVLLAIDDALKQAGLSLAGVASMINEAKLDILRIPDFMANLSTEEYKDRLLNRVQLADQTKSLVRTLMLDKEEEFERKEITWAGLPDIARLYLMVASAAADIPATRLLGQSPDGQNATGESDTRNYYDRISSEQETVIEPAMTVLDECIIRSALGSRPDDVSYVWSPLWQMSEKEQAEIASTKANALKIYIDSGLFPDDAIADGIADMIEEDGLLPGFAAKYEEAGGVNESDPEVQAGFAAIAPPVDPATVEATDAAPKTLYVRRQVLNADEIIAWAKSQGFETTLPADDMHVTIAFSRTPVDWIAVGESWAGSERDGTLDITPGGARVIEKFGEGATVLIFASSELGWRHHAIREKGASWDWPDYQPHITLSYDFDGEISEVEPYRGAIKLGVEAFEEIDPDWKSGISET